MRDLLHGGAVDRRTKWFQPLRKNLGKKNCELGEDDIARICNAFLAFEETEQSKIFDNAAFGYWKVTVDRPLRIAGADPNRVYKAAEIKALKETGKRGEDAPPVLRKIHKRGTEADPLRGLFAANVNGRPAVVEYEPDTDLRDTEQIPLQEDGGVEAFLRREVLPYAADAWYQADSVKVGYEIDDFVERYLDGAERDQLDPILDACVAVYRNDLDEGRAGGLQGQGQGIRRGPTASCRASCPTPTPRGRNAPSS